MRTCIVGLFAVTLVARPLPGQTAPAPVALPQVSCPQRGCNVGGPHVLHISSSADVRLENGVLHYLTGQVLQNNGGENAEVIWTLPLPPSSAFHNLTMSINGEMIMGEIYPKARARAIYEAIVARKRDPALVEWVGRDLLRTSIYPIFPAETKYIEMRLQAAAKQTGNVIRVDYFAGSNSAFQLAPDPATITMKFSYPDSAHYGVPYSNTHFVGNPTVAGGVRTVTLSGREKAATLFLPVDRSGNGSISILPHAIAGEDGYALINIVAPVLPEREVPRDVVIVLDASYSMQGDRFTHATEGTHAALSALGPKDRFRIVAFSNSVVSNDTVALPATAQNIARARQFLGSLKPGGGTNTVAALEDAFRSFDRSAEGRAQRLLLMTDGAPSKGEVRYDSVLSRVASSRGRAEIFVFQVGDSDAPFFYYGRNNVPADLLRDIAQSGSGSFHFAEGDSSIVKLVDSVMRRREPASLTDLRLIAWPIELREIDSASLRSMRPGESRTVAVRYRGSGIGTVHVSAIVNGAYLSWSKRVEFPSEDHSNAFAARLWATERVGAIARLSARGCSATDADSAMTRLGFRHSIPTPMTSYMVLEPGIRIDEKGNVLNAAEFRAQNPVAPWQANASGRSGGSGTPGNASQPLILTAVVTTGLTDPTSGSRAPFSVAQVNSEQLQVAPIGSPLRALAGKVAGLQVRGGNAPGSDVVIQIRNPLSIHGYTQPIIIVDGVIQMLDDPTLGAPPVSGDPLGVPFENIESIEVVRGAAASAMYGQRAANGVIIISTRRGTSPELWESARARAMDVDVPPASALVRTCRAVGGR